MFQKHFSLFFFSIQLRDHEGINNTLRGSIWTKLMKESSLNTRINETIQKRGLISSYMNQQKLSVGSLQT